MCVGEKPPLGGHHPKEPKMPQVRNRLMSPPYSKGSSKSMGVPPKCHNSKMSSPRCPTAPSKGKEGRCRTNISSVGVKL